MNAPVAKSRFILNIQILIKAIEMGVRKQTKLWLCAFR
jgi:hypothetical protein